MRWSRTSPAEKQIFRKAIKTCCAENWNLYFLTINFICSRHMSPIFPASVPFHTLFSVAHFSAKSRHFSSACFVIFRFNGNNRRSSAQNSIENLSTKALRQYAFTFYYYPVWYKSGLCSTHWTSWTIILLNGIWSCHKRIKIAQRNATHKNVCVCASTFFQMEKWLNLKWKEQQEEEPNYRRRRQWDKFESNSTKFRRNSIRTYVYLD